LAGERVAVSNNVNVERLSGGFVDGLCKVSAEFDDIPMVGGPFTAKFFADQGIANVVVRKNSQGTGPMGEKTIVELLNSGGVDLVINTPVGRGTRADGWAIRTAAVQRSIPCITTTAGFSAAVEGIKALQRGDLGVLPIQEWLKK
jgi:carbamoyl-phosphate synthase large subunit